MHRGRRAHQASSNGYWQSNRYEEFGWIKIVLTGLVNDTNVTLACGFTVSDHSIELSLLKILRTVVSDAQREGRSRFLGSHADLAFRSEPLVSRMVASPLSLRQRRPPYLLRSCLSRFIPRPVATISTLVISLTMSKCIAMNGTDSGGRSFYCGKSAEKYKEDRKEGVGRAAVSLEAGGHQPPLTVRRKSQGRANVVSRQVWKIPQDVFL